MAKPEKDQVLDASASETNPGAGSPNPPSSEPGASAPVAADPHGPAAASGGAPGAGSLPAAQKLLGGPAALGQDGLRPALPGGPDR